MTDPEVTIIPKWSCPETSGATSTEQRRRVPDGIEPNFVNTAVAKIMGPNSHFKLSKVTKRANLYGIVLFPRVCFLRCTLSL